MLTRRHSRRLVAALAMLVALAAALGGAGWPARAGEGDTPEEAILITGPLTHVAAPQQTIWYSYYYGTPGLLAVISLNFPATAPNVALDIYAGTPPSLTKIGSGTGLAGTGLLTYSLSATTTAFYYVAVVNHDTVNTLTFTLTAAPIVTAPTPTTTPTMPTPTPTVAGQVTGTPTIAGELTATPTAGPTGEASPSPTIVLTGEATPTPTPTSTDTPVTTPTVFSTPTATSTPTLTPTPVSVLHDNRYFSETGYRIDDDRFWEYFTLRGRTDTFGYPVSRTIPFLGLPTQFFQRAIMQRGPDGNVQLMNLLDPGLMPYNRINFSTYPAFDPSVAGAAPPPGSPDYDTAIVDFVRATAPDVFENLPVRFFATFLTTITCAEAYPAQPCRTDLVPLLNLEIWGSVTSRPMRDPNNPSFVYQRFQRGILHYDDTEQVTRGVLLADYFKSILTGRDLPADLDEESRASRFHRQYCPGQPGWLCRPAELERTDLTFAFEPQ